MHIASQRIHVPVLGDNQATTTHSGDKVRARKARIVGDADGDRAVSRM